MGAASGCKALHHAQPEARHCHPVTMATLPLRFDSRLFMALSLPPRRPGTSPAMKRNQRCCPCQKQVTRTKPAHCEAYPLQ